MVLQIFSDQKDVVLDLLYSYFRVANIFLFFNDLKINAEKLL